MNIPERLWRFPTGAAREKLATRFGLPDEPEMQDWQWEVADNERIDEFLAVYKSGILSDDERYTLMETILESFRGLEEIEQPSLRWQETLDLIENNIELHIYTVCYWACLDLEKDELDLAWECAPQMRAMLNRHRARFDFPPYDV